LARTATAARSAAQAFADHLNAVLNQTVTDSRLSLLAIPQHERQFLIQRMIGKRAAPLTLRPSPLRLFFRQTIEVVDGHCETASYVYRLQAGDNPNSWALRWECFRRPPKSDYPYVLQHLHVNGTLAPGLVKPSASLSHLHIATARVPLESILQHLVTEWGVKAKTGWRTVLDESREGFHRRATAP
jgi:hypothetical protein